MTRRQRAFAVVRDEIANLATLEWADLRARYRLVFRSEPDIRCGWGQLAGELARRLYQDAYANEAPDLFDVLDELVGGGL